ncbi:hypothetical protein [Grimontia sp. NTOU-MAR1]|uniref:hypothetical protein n=1 Tax=Grimontia sp. NTOU-MAR1 TaxID=3111011 RepID=UPI002DB6CCA2|nr:hypothetical protein [Grimontia sp. NTOU-MAR1]WRV98551.1 hypothetical protein VP504_03690 [Grimontia sp. NTOU-MAR1]
MSNKSSLTTPTIANGCAAVFGALALDFATGLEQPFLKENAVYVVPAFTIFLAYIFNVLGSLSAMSITELAAIWSSRGYFKELKDQINDPLISENTREEKRKEYEHALELKLAMKKGKFLIFKTVNQKATEQAEQAVSKKQTQAEKDALLDQVERAS